MAELDPNLILQGVATTHPVLARPLGDTLEQGAHTAEIQAQTGLVHQETAGAGLQNYIAQMNLRNAQIMGTAQMALFNQIRAKSAQGYSPPAGGVTGPAVTPGASSSTPPAATGTAPPPFLAAGPGQPGYQPPAGPGAQPAPNPANAGVIDPNNPPPPPGVTPYAWDYANKNGYKIDTAHDWYTKDDLPISHYSGPELTPAGRPNMLSADMQLQLGDIMQRMGAQPQFIAGLINNGLIKAQAFDAQASKIYQDQASAADSLAKANESNQKVQIAAKNFRADSADGILNSPNPLASLQQDMGAHPHMWDPTLAAVGIAPGQFNPADPKQQGVVLQTLQGLQSTSPQYIDRMSKQAAATAAGVHELHEIDPNTGFPVTSLVQVGSAGAGIAPGLPGATGGPQVNTLVKGTLPAGSESLLDAQAQAIAEYRLPPI
ncbi:MAG: hypothetical protein ACREQ5_09595, partial [Candidatus Dormibacteria bacterium]